MAWAASRARVGLVVAKGGSQAAGTRVAGAAETAAKAVGAKIHREVQVEAAGMEEVARVSETVRAAEACQAGILVATAEGGWVGRGAEGVVVPVARWHEVAV